MLDQSKLLNILESLAPAGMQVLWAGDKRAYYGVNPDRKQKPFTSGSFGQSPRHAGFVECTIKSWRRLGEDEAIRVFNPTPPPGIYRVSYLGLREFTLSLRVECDQIGDAWQISEGIANKLQWPSVRASLKTLGVSCSQILANTALTATWDKREVAANVLDLDMLYRICERDTTADPNGWIQTVGETNSAPPNGIKYEFTNEKEELLQGAYRIGDL